MKFDERLLKVIRELLELPPDSKDPAVEWLAEAVLIVLESMDLSVDQALDDELPAFILHDLEQFRNVPTQALMDSLRKLLRKFEEAGGRGVELADRIDSISRVLSIRRKMRNPYGWPGPREWSPK